ncbi:MAG: hypothetical protein DDT26_00800 [Dehalococcoidia bacterium]|nr:hypothetical protein [Chloroflexota bacterium]
MTRIITATKKLDCEHLLGTFLDESHYDILVDEDCDGYGPPLFGETNGEQNILFKLRKGVFNNEEMDECHAGLIGAAKSSNNRGIAAGPRDLANRHGLRDWVTPRQLSIIAALGQSAVCVDGTDPLENAIKNEVNPQSSDANTVGRVWVRTRVEQELDGEYEGFFDRYVEKFRSASFEERAKAAALLSSFISDTTYATMVNSGVAGFFDRYIRTPYGRACAYNEENPELFARSFPYIRKLDRMYKSLLPGRYANQKKLADSIDSRFLVGGDTVFTTITVNKTFRTAAHRDAGDLGSGFSNLGVLNVGKNFRGAYLVLPEYRIAVNIRPGDLLLIANHDAIHGNTAIEAEPGCCTDCIERLSVVCYFRENMKTLGSFEYEGYRREFIESRRLNAEHPLWRPHWNGVSPACFDGDEWRTFLLNKPNGEELLRTHHPALYNSAAEAATKVTLDDFFAA